MRARTHTSDSGSASRFQFPKGPRNSLLSGPTERCPLRASLDRARITLQAGLPQGSLQCGRWALTGQVGQSLPACGNQPNASIILPNNSPPRAVPAELPGDLTSDDPTGRFQTLPGGCLLPPLPTRCPWWSFEEPHKATLPQPPAQLTWVYDSEQRNVKTKAAGTGVRMSHSLSEAVPPAPVLGIGAAVPSAQSQHATPFRPACWGKAATHHCWTSFSVTARENRRVFFQSKEVSQGWMDTREPPVPSPPRPTACQPTEAQLALDKDIRPGEEPRSGALLGHTSRGGTGQPPPMPTVLLGGLPSLTRRGGLSLLSWGGQAGPSDV